jgi:hypothetical protein
LREEDDPQAGELALVAAIELDEAWVDAHERLTIRARVGRRRARPQLPAAPLGPVARRGGRRRRRARAGLAQRCAARRAARRRRRHDGDVQPLDCPVCAPPDELLALADRRATRSLTAEERRRYLHEDG